MKLIHRVLMTSVASTAFFSASAFAQTAQPEEAASIVGCLCTPLDRLADKGGFPRAEVGDLVAVFCAGAYGASASPAMFLGQGPAAEMLV